MYLQNVSSLMIIVAEVKSPWVDYRVAKWQFSVENTLHQWPPIVATKQA